MHALERLRVRDVARELVAGAVQDLLGFEQLSQPTPHDLVVVEQEDARHRVPLCRA